MVINMQNFEIKIKKSQMLAKTKPKVCAPLGRNTARTNATFD